MASFRATRIEGTESRIVLAALITDPVVCGRVYSGWRDDAFGDRNNPDSILARLAVTYFEKYRVPARRDIVTVVERWASKVSDDAVVKAVADLLGSLFTDPADMDKPCDNSPHVIDMATQLFLRIAVETTINDAKSFAAARMYDKAEQTLTSLRKIEVGGGKHFSVTTDDDGTRAHLDHIDKADLFTYPGEAGRFFDGQLQRDSFLAILAPEKTGKSMDLMDMAVRASKARRRVAYIEAGDMSERQIVQRFASRIAKHPRQLRGVTFPYDMPYPKRMRVIRSNGAFVPEVEYETIRYEDPIDPGVAVAALHRFRTKEILSNDDYIRLKCHPCGTVSVAQIESIIQAWMHNGWVPDVVIIDYADILAPMPGTSRMDERGQINESWKAMRSMAQSLHCLVVTATQADADSYGKHLITRKNFSGDKRKLSHVTAMMGINMTDEEKEKGITRRNWIVMREGAYSTSEVIHVASCLAVCNPWVVSAR